MQINESATTTSVRRLKIEEHGDAWNGLLKPKIRLIGRWLEKAGFGGIEVMTVAREPQPPHLQTLLATGVKG